MHDALFSETRLDRRKVGGRAAGPVLAECTAKVNLGGVLASRKCCCDRTYTPTRNTYWRCGPWADQRSRTRILAYLLTSTPRTADILPTYVLLSLGLARKRRSKKRYRSTGAPLIPSLCHYLLPPIAYRAIDVHVTRRLPVSSAGCIRCTSFSALAGTISLEPSRVVP